jgi:hypothetical protein
MIPRFYQIPGNFPKYKPILAYTGPSQYIPTGYPSTHPFLSLTGSLNGIEIEPVHTFGFQSHFSSTKTYNQKPTIGMYVPTCSSQSQRAFSSIGE